MPALRWKCLKNLASDETSYRSITDIWFEHSALAPGFEKIADKKLNLIVATDHGSVRVNTPQKWLVINKPPPTFGISMAAI